MSLCTGLLPDTLIVGPAKSDPLAPMTFETMPLPAPTIEEVNDTSSDSSGESSKSSESPSVCFKCKRGCEINLQCVILLLSLSQKPQSNRFLIGVCQYRRNQADSNTPKSHPRTWATIAQCCFNPVPKPLMWRLFVAKEVVGYWVMEDVAKGLRCFRPPLPRFWFHVSCLPDATSTHCTFCP